MGVSFQLTANIISSATTVGNAASQKGYIMGKICLYTYTVSVID